jgi:hypothetical protein
VTPAEQDAEEEHPAEQQLLVAPSEGDAARVQQLLAGGAEPACETAEGVTPLMLAAGSGSEEAVQALLGVWVGCLLTTAARGADDVPQCSRGALFMLRRSPSASRFTMPFCYCRRRCRGGGPLARPGRAGAHRGGVRQWRRPPLRRAPAAGLGGQSGAHPGCAALLACCQAALPCFTSFLPDQPPACSPTRPPCCADAHCSWL